MTSSCGYNNACTACCSTRVFTGIPMDAQTLTYRGRPLEDQEWLQSCGIQQQSKLQLIICKEYKSDPYASHTSEGPCCRKLTSSKPAAERWSMIESGMKAAALVVVQVRLWLRSVAFYQLWSISDQSQHGTSLLT